jgi:two-component system, NarL family, response regulator DegU
MPGAGLMGAMAMDGRRKGGAAHRNIELLGANPEGPWRVLIVDDHPVLRGGLKACLPCDELEVAGEASNGREAVAAVRKLRPDLVLMDVEMPDMSGLEALRCIKEEAPGVVVVMLTAFPNEAYLIQAAVDGASGFLLKSDEDTDIGGRLIEILRGDRAPRGRWWDAALAHVRALAARRRQEAPTPPSHLTTREVGILKHFAHGLSSAEICHFEKLADVTLRKHCSLIYRKLGVSDRTQAVMKGIREGWLSAAESEG